MTIVDPLTVDNMRTAYLLLSVAAPLASALVIPDETVLAEIASQTPPVNEQHGAVSFDRGPNVDLCRL